MAHTVDLPPGKSTVRVRMLDSTASITINSEHFIKPAMRGLEALSVATVVFLVENEALGRRVLFDLGTRKDYWTHPPAVQASWGAGRHILGMKVEQDVAEILAEKHVALASVDAVIWSHWHYDHTGNVALFPASTALVVGAGFAATRRLTPGFPHDSKSLILASDLERRTVTEVDFSAGLTVGGFAACDFFGDGSFYLLDTPGHCAAHMCGLARTTEHSFVFMGGDICHFAGVHRPSRALALPDPIPAGVLDAGSRLPCPCPCSVFARQHPRAAPEGSRTTAFFEIPDGRAAAYSNVPAARESVAKLQHFDDDERVLVCLAHDNTLLQVLPTFNKDPAQDINRWRERGWKEKCHWGWLNQLPYQGAPSRPPLVEGFWRDGKQWDYEAYKNKRKSSL